MKKIDVDNDRKSKKITTDIYAMTRNKSSQIDRKLSHH